MHRFSASRKRNYSDMFLTPDPKDEHVVDRNVRPRLSSFTKSSYDSRCDERDEYRMEAIMATRRARILSQQKQESVQKLEAQVKERDEEIAKLKAKLQAIATALQE